MVKGNGKLEVFIHHSQLAIYHLEFLMLNFLLPTKLYMPPSRPDLTPRPRLLTALTPQPQTKLILIAAPAGYGKTTLATAWLQHLQTTTTTHTSWLSLNETDSDLQQFFRYLAAAIEPLPNAQTELDQLLQTQQPLAATPLISAFIHDVAAISTPFILLLDDYHTLESADIDQALATLLDYMPPHITLAITSRTDPGFPLSRLRARGQLIEIRADDLRFTPEETADFLQQALGLTLTPQQITAIEQRTEGWITGLQLAALSMRGQTDTSAFINTFTGTHRFILDYLIEEALQNQPEHIRHFLLQTAILDRLTARLCDAVTETSNSQETLESLERDNLFIIPLDGQRQWYRYHHLFADALRMLAQTTLSDQFQHTHKRASQWYAQQGATAEAIHHGFLAGDIPHTADLIERAWRAMDRSFQEAKWLSWAEKLPAEQIRQRPVLSAGYGWALLDTGRITEAIPHLDTATNWLDAPSAEMIIADEQTFAELRGTLTTARAYLAQAQGDLAATQYYAQEALTLIPENDHFYRAIPALTLGLAQWASGQLPAASRSFSQAIINFQQANNLLFEMNTYYVLGETWLAQGRLRDTAALYEREIARLTNQGQLLFSVLTLFQLNLSQIHHQQGDLETAVQHWQRAQELSEQSGRVSYRVDMMLADIKRAQGEPDEAITLLDQAQANFQPGRSLPLAPIPAVRARIWISQGHLEKASRWAAQHDLPAADGPTYLREFEHLTWVRLCIALYNQTPETNTLQPAEDLLNTMLEAAEHDQRTASVIEILMLQALTHAAKGDAPAALPPLTRALTLAEPERFVYLFVYEGEVMRELLKAAVQNNIATTYATHLLSFYGETADTANQPLIEPLSERELEILSLIAAGLKNQEIADQLFISLNTILYHNKNIYSKLGVNKRTQAAAKARELGLI